MEKELLGKYTVPGIGFGTLGNTCDAGCVLVEAALAEGYRYIDTSRYSRKPEGARLHAHERRNGRHFGAGPRHAYRQPQARAGLGSCMNLVPSVCAV